MNYKKNIVSDPAGSPVFAKTQSVTNNSRCERVTTAVMYRLYKNFLY